MDDERFFAGVAGQAALVRDGQLSSRELATACEGRLNAFTNVMRAPAPAEAEARDRAQADGRETGPLHGVPVAIKEERTPSSTGTTCCSPPTIAHRRPDVGVLDGVGSLRASLHAMPMIAYTALWNVTGTPQPRSRRASGATGCPSPYSSSVVRTTSRRS